jgi:hypothetical protein
LVSGLGGGVRHGVRRGAFAAAGRWLDPARAKHARSIMHSRADGATIAHNSPMRRP